MNCPKFIPGIELSAEEDGKEIHILGYFPFGGFENLKDFILTQQLRRNVRNIQMCELLTKQGMSVSIEELKSQGSTVIGKLHAANLLMKKGYVGSVKEAFEDWIGYDKPCYAKRVKSSAKEAIKAIADAGGVSVVAHPFLYKWTGNEKTVSSLLFRKIFKLKNYGISGVESFHGEATLMQSLETNAVAETLNLISTFGSDYHGENKHGLLMYSKDNIPNTFIEKRIVAGIIELDEKILMINKKNELFAPNWQLPSILQDTFTHNEINLKKCIEELFCVQIEAINYYTTAFCEVSNISEVFIAYKCEINRKEQLIESCSDKVDYGLFSLTELSRMNLRKADSIIIEKLREITMFNN